MTTHLNPRDLPLGHDESCAADLHAVIESRMLGRNATSWLARAVAGAIRPSRDRPVWDLAHAIAALGLDGPGLIDLTLDPTRTTAAALQDSLAGNPAADDRGHRTRRSADGAAVDPAGPEGTTDVAVGPAADSVAAHHRDHLAVDLDLVGGELHRFHRGVRRGEGDLGP